MPVTHPLARACAQLSLARIPPRTHLPSRAVVLGIRLDRIRLYHHLFFTSQLSILIKAKGGIPKQIAVKVGTRLPLPLPRVGLIGCWELFCVTQTSSNAKN